MTEIVRLRDEARTALVHFRALLASRLDGRSNSGEFATDALVKELRIQAVEVERELRLLRRRGKGGDIGIATAALMFVIYGAVSHDPAIAATALVGALTTLATMHAGSKETIASTERLKDRAPYVLVHARQMLAHRGS